MYNQTYIDICGDKTFDSIIQGNIAYKFDIKKDSFEDTRLYFIFQHYLVKCIEEKRNIPQCQQYIIDMYNDFLKQPYKFINSPLLKDEVIDMMFPNSKNNEIIKKCRDNYYNTQRFKELLEARKKRELTEDEKNQYYSSLIHFLRKRDNQNEQLLNYEINRIINSNKKVSDFNEMELQFYSQYVSDFVLKSNMLSDKTYSTVMIGKDVSGSRGSQTHHTILINKNMEPNDIVSLTKTICHESRHTMQVVAAAKDISKEAFEMSQRVLFSRYLDNSSYDSYKTNYKYSTIELDAEHYGYWNASLFFGTFNRRDLSQINRNNRKERLDKRNYYTYMVTKDNKPVPIDAFIVYNMDNIIKQNPNELNNYPVLKQIYNTDGTKKDFKNILFQRVNQQIENRGVFDNYINYGIHRNELDSIHLDELDKESINNLFRSFGMIYRDKMIKLQDYFDDEVNLEKLSENKKYNATKQIEKTTIYEIKLSRKLISYVNNNFDKIVASLDERISNRTHIYDFIYDLRDFKIDSIKNEAIKNNPNIISEFNELQNDYKELLSKFNNALVVQNLDHYLTEEEKNMVITLPDGSKSSISNLFINKITPLMDGHQEITKNGQKISIYKLIKGCKEKINESKKDELKRMLDDNRNMQSVDNQYTDNYYK